MTSTFIRECWNQGMKPDEFAEIIKNNHMNEFQSIIQMLSIICGTLEKSIILLYEYLASLFQNFSVEAAKSIDLDDANQINGCILTFSQYGEKIFNPDEIYSIDSCNSALKILEIALKCQDQKLLEVILKKISCSHYLPVCIAAARVLLPEYYKKLKINFQKLNLNFKASTKNHLEANLVYSLNETLNYPHPKLFFTENVIDLFFSVFHKMLNHVFMLRMNNIQTLQRIYLLLLSYHYKNPRVSFIFILTSFLSPLIHLKMQGVEVPFDDIDCSFDIDKFVDVINAIPDQFFDEYKINKKDHLNGFTKLYDGNDIHYLNLIYQYPSLISNIIPHYINLLNSDNNEDVKAACKEITANFQDFGYLILSTKKLEKFLNVTLFRLQNINDQQTFTDLIFCLITLMKEFWKGGEPSIRSTIVSIILSTSMYTNYLLSCFLQTAVIDLDSAYQYSLQGIQSSSSHIERCYAFLCYLLHNGTQNFEQLLEFLKQYQYLWISVFAWAFTIKTEEPLKFFKIKFPNYSIFQDLYSLLIVFISDGKRFKISEYCEYDLYIRFSDRLNDELEILVSSIFGKTDFFLLDPYLIFYDFMLCCRAYASLNEEKKLIDKIFNLISRSPGFSDYDDIYMIMSGILSASISLTFDEIPEKPLNMIKMLTNMVSNNSFSTIELKLIVPFCYMMIISMKEGLDERLEMVIQFCKKAISGNDKSQQISVFAYYFMKMLIYFPYVKQRIPLEMYQIFNIHGDLKALIDFFKIRAMIIENNHSLD